MKITILGIAILAMTSAACQQPATTTNTTHSNHTVVTNTNAAATTTAASANTTNASANSNMAGMTAHQAMDHGSMQSSPNAQSAPFDLQFLDTMIAHHQGAIDMAQMAVQKTQNAALKQFAQKIIDDQRKEISQMKSWREKWYAGKPEALNMEMPGMRDSMKMMTAEEMKKMEAASGKDFDLMFLDMMTPHHAGATEMAKDALKRAEHPEIKQISESIIRAQEKEIAQMNQWKIQWSK